MKGDYRDGVTEEEVNTAIENLCVEYASEVQRYSEMLLDYRKSHVSCVDDTLGGGPTSTDRRCEMCKDADVMLARRKGSKSG